MLIDNIIDKYLGLEYVDNGRDLVTGLDCWGLIMFVIEDIFEISIPDLNYKKRGLLRKYVKAGQLGEAIVFGNKDEVVKSYDLHSWVDPIHTTPILGDIMLICPIENLAIHAGVYLNKGKFIHSISGQGVIVSDVVRWNTQIEGYYRLKINMFKVRIKNNIFDKKTHDFNFPYIHEFTIWDYLNGDNNPELDTFFSILNNEHYNLIKTGTVQFLLNYEIIDPPQKINTIVPHNGDELLIIITPKAALPFLASLIIGLALSIATSAISYLLMPKPDPPATSNVAEIDNSSVYNWEGPTTSYALGRPVPIIYGDHATGGSFINAMVEGLPYGQGRGWYLPEKFDERENEWSLSF